MAVRNAEQGLYTPDDMLWRVHREALLVFAGGRAVLLEIAHPLIAAGVANHSNYRRRPLKRLFRTVWTVQALSFGDMTLARKAAKRMHHTHRRVHGVLAEDVGPMPAGTPYDARDVELDLWVFATLVDSILLAYDTFVRPLTGADKAAYYEDSKRMAHMMGVPPKYMPPTYADFSRYMEDVIDGGDLAVGDLGRYVAGGLFSHPVVGPAARLGTFAGIGMLPEHLRDRFGFKWDDRRQRWLERLAGFTRWLRGWMPDLFLVQPPALLAEWRHRWRVKH